MQSNVAYAQPAYAPVVAPARRLTLVQGGAAHPQAPAVIWKRGTKRSLALCIAAVTALVLITAALLFAQAVSRSTAYDAAVSAIDAAASVTVQPGDTLWGIAQGHAVDGLSTRQVVDLVKDWNQLDGGLISPGMTLIVPAA